MGLTATLINELNRYEVGAKALRQRERMSLTELGRRTRLSSSLVSRVELGKMYPTLPTRQRIALVLRVDLRHFFHLERSDMAVVRRGERLRFPERPDAERISYDFESLDFATTGRKLRAYLAEFESRPLDQVRRRRHDDDELVFVMSGTLGLCLEEGEMVLENEDAVCIRGGRPHGYRRIGRRRCRAVVVVRP